MQEETDVLFRARASVHGPPIEPVVLQHPRHLPDPRHRHAPVLDESGHHGSDFCCQNSILFRKNAVQIVGERGSREHGIFWYVTLRRCAVAFGWRETVLRRAGTLQVGAGRGRPLSRCEERRVAEGVGHLRDFVCYVLVLLRIELDL